jgi:hypothetical protein
MKMRKILRMVPFAVLLLTTGAQLRPAPAQLTTSDLMKAKLVAAQKVLEGISTEDFTLVGRSANQLLDYSKASAWMVQQSPEYARFTEDFRRQSTALAREARNKNVDGATVAYFQLTISCVNCHKLIRSH